MTVSLVQGEVYPRVCGGTGTRENPRKASPSGVYPRVCGGTSFSASVAARSNVRVYPRVCGGTLSRRSEITHTP